MSKMATNMTFEVERKVRNNEQRLKKYNHLLEARKKENKKEK